MPQLRGFSWGILFFDFTRLNFSPESEADHEGTCGGRGGRVKWAAQRNPFRWIDKGILRRQPGENKPCGLNQTRRVVNLSRCGFYRAYNLRARCTWGIILE